MAVLFVDSGAAVTQTNGATHTVAKPAGAAAGDLLLVGICTEALATITPPAGWTSILRQPAALETALEIFRADGAVAALAFTISNAAAGSASRMRRYTGQDATPIDVSAGVASADADGTIDAPSVTPTVNDTMLVTFHAKALDSLTWTTPTGMGNPANADSPAATFASLSSFDLLRTDTTATGIKTSTASAFSSDGAGIALCIKPAAAGVVVPGVLPTIASPTSLLPGPWLLDSPLAQVFPEPKVAGTISTVLIAQFRSVRRAIAARVFGRVN